MLGHAGSRKHGQEGALILGSCFHLESLSAGVSSEFDGGCIRVSRSSVGERMFEVKLKSVGAKPLGQGLRLICSIGEADSSDPKQFTDLNWVARRARTLKVVTEDGNPPDISDPMLKEVFRNIVFVSCREVGLYPHQVGVPLVMSVMREIFQNYLDSFTVKAFLDEYKQDIQQHDQWQTTSRKLHQLARDHVLNRQPENETWSNDIDSDTDSDADSDTDSDDFMILEKCTTAQEKTWLTIPTAVNNIIRPVTDIIGATWRWIHQDTEVSDDDNF
ncbi:hypothetical protein GNI_045650 [Gregarina niphandrodes]|uniref:Uncharacterized protein n=1 Tax=Gregarina niphandrodes TaxID=110365 RepID=A0A023B9Y8_GRENI|nr:hypothetical protein GNI_045650 [Gregarina niphandrodes]EZG76055.1 hypothetical protein GNI_045650 [Gregarina niphandrodes]|eukprot:XP_011129589.1 hypothetical protein GNI_045650 [Gregarina niphandrodes]